MLTCGPFALCGDWDETPTPHGLTRLILTPSFAHSNGWSPWTQAGLLALVEHCKPGMTVLDVGTGSGILAIAAALLGARQVWATDIHPDALAAATANVSANSVEQVVTLVEGSVLLRPVDLAIVSISTQWVEDNGADLHATTLLIVHDDATVEVRHGAAPESL